MYANYFGLRHEPFSIAPDPRYLYMSERHREALAHLLYGLSSGGGFVLLTGEIGTGKTTVCRAFLEQVPAHCNVAYIFNPKLTALELLRAVCDEFRVAVPEVAGRQPTVKDHIDPLNTFLLEQHAAGRSNVLIIDEAQNLSADVLEQLRLLTNLETHERKLLQIILIGQPELREMLERPELEQLAQRVIARYHLQPLTEAETSRYVRHRLAVAGMERVPPFEARVLRDIHRLSHGVPRRINLLCDRALLGAYARTRGSVSRATLAQAAEEVFGRRPERPRTGLRALGWSAMGLAGVAALLAGAWGAGWLALPGVTPLAQGDALALQPGLQAAAPALAASGLQPAAASATPGPQASARAALPAASEAAAATAAPTVLLSDRDEAWRELARHWGAEPGSSGAACTELAGQGLQCFTSPMSLSLIRQLNRPGVLTLDARTTQPRYALLVGLGPDSATLRAGDTEQTVTLRALAERWDGEFATLWRAPPGGHGASKARPWVLKVLAEGEAAEPGTQASLPSRLRNFQLAQGLPATGTLAPTTFMQLNRAAGIEEPQLRAQP